MMSRGYLICPLICCVAALPLLSLAADTPATAPSSNHPTTVPVVQLTVQPARFLDHDNCVGNLLLRELQRQAVLIAARDELGLGTRDLVLREPFTRHGSNGVTTVLFESRIWRGDQAQICLARFDGNQSANPYALADVQVDRPQNTCQQWSNFKISKDPLVDYPQFVTKCEEASRGAYLGALRAEKVLGDFEPNPVHWVDAGTADPNALQHMRQMDVFSQYIAIRRLHDQIRSDGASTDRISALVRAYANLAALTGNQWSQANKAFMARSLLYAERLVVHQDRSSASLYARAYARAFAGLHEAALSDLNTITQRNETGSTEPDWIPLIRGLCLYDPSVLQQQLAIGPWHNRPLTAYLAAVVAGDGFTPVIQQTALDRALELFPGMFVLAPQVTPQVYGNQQQQPDQIVNEIPVVIINTLGDAGLSPAMQLQIRSLRPGSESYRQLAALRDQLNHAASRFPCDAREPSLGVLADLIEQQELVGLVRWTAAMRNINDPLAPRANPAQPQDARAANPILDAHPWGPFVQALSIGTDNSDQQSQALARIKDRNMGAWVDEAINHLQAQGRDTSSLEDAWRHPADLSADALVTDYSPHMVQTRATNQNQTDYLFHLCKTSPHSATLAEAWMRSIALEQLAGQKPMYERAVKRVETEFADRPGLLRVACDWCNQLGDFDRSLDLLNKLNPLEPSARNYSLTARILHRLGRRDEAVTCILRGTQVTDNSGSPEELCYQAANYLIEDQHYADALNCIQQASDGYSPQSPASWQMMARCYEAMGQFDDADECFRQLEVTYPTGIGQHYLWAKRLGRHDANDLRRKAVAYAHQPGDFVNDAYAVCIANDQEKKALSLLRQNAGTDPLDLAQVVVLATKLNNKAARNNAMGQFNNGYGVDRSFGLAFKTLVESKDLAPAMAAFDSWADHQLYDDDAMDWYSLTGRYLVAAGHAAEGKAYLIRAIRQTARERENYYLAWRELLQLGEDPKALLAGAATKPS